jgi:hypothetical protein
LTPSIFKSIDVPAANSNVKSIQMLLNLQNERIIKLLNVAKIMSPYLFHPDAAKTYNGILKIVNILIERSDV